MTDPTIIAELRQIERRLMGRLDAIEARLTAPPSKLSRADRAMLARLLPAIAGAFGSKEFFSAEIVEDDAPGLRLVCHGVTVRQLGKLLKRATGVPIGAYVVERTGIECGAIIWRVLGIS